MKFVACVSSFGTPVPKWLSSAMSQYGDVRLWLPDITKAPPSGLSPREIKKLDENGYLSVSVRFTSDAGVQMLSIASKTTKEPDCHVWLLSIDSGWLTSDLHLARTVVAELETLHRERGIVWIHQNIQRHSSIVYVIRRIGSKIQRFGDLMGTVAKSNLRTQNMHTALAVEEIQAICSDPLGEQEELVQQPTLAKKEGNVSRFRHRYQLLDMEDPDFTELADDNAVADRFRLLDMD